MGIIKRYTEERLKWLQAGKPIRSEEKIKELFSICKTCPHFQKTREYKGTCGICGCGLKEYGYVLNKLSWSTTQCPLEEPKWGPEPGYTTEELAAKEPVPIEQPKPAKKGGCGCGKK